MYSIILNVQMSVPFGVFQHYETTHPENRWYCKYFTNNKHRQVDIQLRDRFGTIVSNSYIWVFQLSYMSVWRNRSKIIRKRSYYLIVFFSNVTEVDTRLSTLETKTHKNQTAVFDTPELTNTVKTTNVNCWSVMLIHQQLVI